jgi:hypothetical protein
MMGVRTPETCWAVNKRQVIKLEKFLHLVSWFIWIVWRCTDIKTLNFENKIFIIIIFIPPLFVVNSNCLSF